MERKCVSHLPSLLSTPKLKPCHWPVEWQALPSPICWGGVDRVPNYLWHLANDRNFWTGLKRENLFHGHETFSSKVREKAFCPYLTLTVGLTVSLSGPGKFWGSCGGEERGRNTQQEEPEKGEQKPMNKNASRCGCVWGRGCQTAIASPWDHRVSRYFKCLFRSSLVFPLEESLNFILLCQQHPHSQPTMDPVLCSAGCSDISESVFSS